MELKLLLNILLSVFLGFAIGFERKLRSKEAGIRTHTIVCLGACLLMLLSKYGFGDETVDKARIAAQIVSGIGFIGAGLIVYRKRTVQGLTTAAGVWATAGIGMCCGAGLYILAVGTTIILVGVQCILHLNCKVFKPRKEFELKITFVQEKDENERIKELFNVNHFNKVVVNRVNDKFNYIVTLYVKDEVYLCKLDEIMQNNPFIMSIEKCIEEQ